MKIYPSPHKTAIRSRQKFLDIPLAHIEKEYEPESIEITLSDNYAMNTERVISPFQEFDTSNFLAFDQNDDIESIELRYKDGIYTYEPECNEYKPDSFMAQMVLKRRNIYSSSRIYNWRVGIQPNEYGQNLSSRLINIFGDASYHGVAPTNITVNGAALEPSSLLAEKADNTDFYFIGGYDENNKGLDMGVYIDFDKILDKFTNIWVVASNAEAQRYFLKDAKGYTVEMASTAKRPYTEIYQMDDSYPWMAAIVPRVPILEVLGYNCINNEIFRDGSAAPVIVYQKSGAGCVIVSQEDLLKDPAQNFRLIYDIMMSVYLRGFMLSQPVSSWITDKNIDRIGTMRSPLGRNHKKILFEDFFADKEDKNLYDVYLTKTDNDNITMREISNDQVFFSKIENTDPEVPAGSISMMTHKGTVVIVKEKGSFRLVESKVKITSEIKDKKCYIAVHPFISSSARIAVRKIWKFLIKDPTHDYYIVALPINDEKESKVMLIMDSDYLEESTDGYTIATVHVTFSGTDIAYDIRMMGGGLPATYTDYNMLDIGTPKGRPYRMGTGAVIRIPKAYKKYEEEIAVAVSKYKVAADRIYIIYV